MKDRAERTWDGEESYRMLLSGKDMATDLGAHYSYGEQDQTI